VFQSVEPEVWGYRARPIDASAFEQELADELAQRLAEFQVLPEDREPCRDKSGYFRASVNIPLSARLFDQFLNGSSGYRAQYFIGIDNGERFNRILVERIAPLIVEAEDLYRGRFDRLFCERSLLGPFTKFWYSKEITDPSASEYLSGLPEVIRVGTWVSYWRQRPKPWKGLLAPLPEDKCVLLNGTFINPENGDAYEQKPERSRHIHECGWT
jgi:hypothetical protein